MLKRMLFSILLFLISFIAFQKQQKAVYLILALLSANIAIYYKETVFIAVGVFLQDIFPVMETDK